MNNEQIKTNVWRAAFTVGILLTVFLAVLSIKELKSINYVGRDVAASNTITVTGKGESFIAPDIATFSFSVTETSKDIVDAQNKATVKVNAATKALKDAGVADKDIKTTGYNINPHYEYQSTICPANSGYCPGGKQVLTGYDVSQTTEVKIRDLKKAGALFATIGSLGVQNVNGLTFSIDDIDAVKAKARAAAIDNAKAKAETLASQLGVSIVRITSFTDQTDQGYYPVAYDTMSVGVMKASAPAAAPEISTGEQKVTSNVSITYEIR
jgi:uncharacterized protein YggE